MKFDVVLMDPPWRYGKLQGPNSGASLQYPTMTDDEIAALPIRDMLKSRAAVFMWATCPLLERQMKLFARWGLRFAGVPFVWVKTTKAGHLMGAKGGPPSVVKPVVEMVLLGTNTKSGRPLPLRSYNTRQVIVAAPTRHSEKPIEVHRRIENLFGPDADRLEMFARKPYPGWHRWGNECKPTIRILPRTDGRDGGAVRCAGYGNHRSLTGPRHVR